MSREAASFVPAVRPTHRSLAARSEQGLFGHTRGATPYGIGFGLVTTAGLNL